LALLASFHGWAVVGQASVSASAAEGGRPLRVTTVNVHHANADRRAILDYIRAVSPDILVLEEAWADKWADTRREIASLLPAQAPEGAQSESIPFLFSRYPVTAFAKLRPADASFGLLRAEIAVGESRLTLLALHPPYPVTRALAGIRNAHLAVVAEAGSQAGTPFLAVGDFNATPWSPHFADMVKAAGLRNAAGSAAGLSTWPTWFWPAGIPIDHVLVKGGVSVVGLTRGPNVGSDHYPLTVDLLVRR
jgi:endonuclease/exonuclease/phosphatase (EEP) superfamily protein YafD